MKATSQLALMLPVEPRFGREDFLVSPSNEAAWDMFERWPNWPGRMLLLLGPTGSGKSHLAAIWAQRAGIPFDVQIPHLNPASVSQNDTVIGTLPVQSVAQICAQGARYLHLTFDMPADKRGGELSADDLTTLGAQLRAFTAHAA